MTRIAIRQVAEAVRVVGCKVRVVAGVIQAPVRR